MSTATVRTTAIRADLDNGCATRPAWAAIGRAVGDDAADLLPDLLGVENTLIDFACDHDLGGNLRTTLQLAWTGSCLTVTDPRSGDSETLFERKVL